MPKVEDRIREILGPDYEIGENDVLSYTWIHAYERLEVVHENGGGYSYSGAWHPDGSCIGNPCRYCGKAFPVFGEE